MKAVVVILFIALVGASGYALYLSRQGEADRQQIAELQARLQEMETAQQAAAAALARQAQAAALPEPVASPAPQGELPQAAPTVATAAMVEDLRERMTNPEGRDVRRAQRRMLLPQTLPNIGKWLALTPEEESRLLDVIARQESEQSEAILDPANRDNPAAQQQAALDWQARRQADDAELATLLGSKYPQYQEYRQTTGVHRQVGQLQAMLGSGVDGLPESQARSLTQALVAEQLRINQERSSAPAAPPPNTQELMRQQQRRTAENNRRLLQVAAAQLNPQQLEGYRKLVEEQERIGGALTRAIGEAAEMTPATAR